MGFRITFGKQRNRSKGRAFAGGLISLSMAATAIYISVFGSELQGGIIFISAAANNMIGRIIFGVSGLFLLLLAYIAFYEFKNLIQTDHKSEP